MKNLTGRKAISHERILAAGARAVRRVGFRGVNVAEVMKDAGLTHGGFYAHFESRDELLSASLLKASADIGMDMRAHVARLTRAGVSPLRALIETYLYDDHVRDCENGCPVPAVCAEAPLQSAEVVDAARSAVKSLQATVSQVLPASVPQDCAWSIAATLVGAVQMARVLGHNQAGRTVLDAVRNDLLTRYDNVS